MDTKKQIKALFTIAVVAMAVMVTSANAEITVDGPGVTLNGNGGATSQTVAFSADNSDKLVVAVTGEHHFNNTNGNVISITYRGQTLVKAVEREPVEAGTDTLASDIWYLDDPDSFAGTDEIIVSFSGRNWTATAIRLSGTAVGVGATAVSDPDSKTVDLTTLGADSLVLAVHGMGGSGNNADVVNVDAVLPAIEITAVEAGANYAGHVTSYTNGVSAGAATYSFTGGSTDGTVTIAAAFEAAIIDPNLPTIEIGDDWITWSGQPVELLPVVVNNDIEEQRSLTHVWTTDPNTDPNTEVLFTEDGINPDDTATPEAVVTVIKAADTDNATVFKLTLTVTLDGELPVVETMEIDVYDDACDAAVAIGSKVIIEATDFNRDCVTDMTDISEMALAWLLDYSMTAPTEAP